MVGSSLWFLATDVLRQDHMKSVGGVIYADLFTEERSAGSWRNRLGDHILGNAMVVDHS